MLIGNLFLEIEESFFLEFYFNFYLLSDKVRFSKNPIHSSVQLADCYLKRWTEFREKAFVNSW